MRGGRRWRGGRRRRRRRAAGGGSVGAAIGGRLGLEPRLPARGGGRRLDLGGGLLGLDLLAERTLAITPPRLALSPAPLALEVLLVLREGVMPIGHQLGLAARKDSSRCAAASASRGADAPPRVLAAAIRVVSRSS